MTDSFTFAIVLDESVQKISDLNFRDYMQSSLTVSIEGQGGDGSFNLTNVALIERSDVPEDNGDLTEYQGIVHGSDGEDYADITFRFTAADDSYFLLEFKSDGSVNVSVIRDGDTDTFTFPFYSLVVWMDESNQLRGRFSCGSDTFIVAPFDFTPSSSSYRKEDGHDQFTFVASSPFLSDVQLFLQYGESSYPMECDEGGSLWSATVTTDLPVANNGALPVVPVTVSCVISNDKITVRPESKPRYVGSLFDGSNSFFRGRYNEAEHTLIALPFSVVAEGSTDVYYVAPSLTPNSYSLVTDNMVTRLSGGFKESHVGEYSGLYLFSGDLYADYDFGDGSYSGDSFPVALFGSGSAFILPGLRADSVSCAGSTVTFPYKGYAVEIEVWGATEDDRVEIKISDGRGVWDSCLSAGSYTVEASLFRNNELFDTVTGQVEIRQIPLTFSSAVTIQKEYDGTTDIPAISDDYVDGFVVDSDAGRVKCSPVCSFPPGFNGSAGTYNDIPASYVLSGSRAENYIVPAPSTVSIEITKKPLEVDLGKAEIKNKSYDGTTRAKVILLEDAVSGILDQDKDEVFVTARGEFYDAEIGVNKEVTVSYYLTGKRAFNYSIEPTTHSASIKDPLFIYWTATNSGAYGYDVVLRGK